MKKTLLTSSAFVLLASGASFGAITVAIYPSLGPSRTLGFTSPSFDGYAANAISGLENGLPNVGGDRNTTPTAYSQDTVFSVASIAQVDFNAWNGIPGPFAPPLDQERNSTLFFGLHITAIDETFSPYNVTSEVSSGDSPFDLSAFSEAFIFDVFSPRRVGLSYGPDGIKGTADDEVFTSGSMEGVEVNEFFFVGDAITFNNNGPSFQAGDLAELRLLEPFELTSTYRVFADDEVTLLSSGTITVTIIPEPSTALLSALALGGLALRRRRMA